MIYFNSCDTQIFLRSIFLTTNTIGFHCFYMVYFTGFLEFFISFISLYSSSTVFAGTNSSWLIYESIKTLDIKTLIVFYLAFTNYFIMLCPLFLHNWLILLNSCSYCTNFIPIAELTIPIGTQANEANAEIETQPLIAFYLTDLYLKLTKTSRTYIAGHLHKNSHSKYNES